MVDELHIYSDGKMWPDITMPCNLFQIDTSPSVKLDIKGENMPNIKITTEVDGKQVPLETISDETFQAIKAAAKTEKIPVTRYGEFRGAPRLLFKPSQNINLKIGNVYSLNLIDGNLGAGWELKDNDCWTRQYKNIKSL